MKIKRTVIGEDAYHKMEDTSKFLGDPYVSENRKNIYQETKEIHDTKRAKSMMCGRRVLIGTVIMMVVMAGIGAGVSLASSSHILHELGFTSKGLASKSFASRLMSSTSKANNHTVPQDSWVSWLQKAGQKGLSAEHQAYFGTAGAIAGVVFAVVVVVVAVVVYSIIRRYKRHSSE